MKIESITPILYAIGSVISFVTMQIFVKLLSEQITVQYILQVRSLILFAINSIFILNSNYYAPYQKSQTVKQLKFYFSFNFKSNSFLMLMIKRQLFNSISINIYLSSLKYMHISIANALLNTAPIISYFVKVFFYKKSLRQLSIVQVLLTILSFVGVFIILNPFGHVEGYEFNLFLLMPIVAAVATCFNYLYLYELRNKCNQLVVLEYTYTFQLLISSIISTAVGGTNSGSSLQQTYTYIQMLGLIVVISALTYVSQWMRIKAVFKIKPSEIMMYNYAGMLYAIIVDAIIFKIHIEWLTILGVLLTSTGLMSQFAVKIFKKSS